MRELPITKGRKKAVRRIKKLLETESNKAKYAMRRAIHIEGDGSEEAMIASARYAETENLRIALNRDLDAYLQALSERDKKAQKTDTAAGPRKGAGL